MRKLFDLFRVNRIASVVIGALCLIICLLQTKVYDSTVVMLFGSSFSEAIETEFIYAIGIFLIYYALLKFSYKSWVRVKVNDILLILLLASAVFYALLEINYLFAYSDWHKCRFDIVRVKRMSVSKATYAPEILMHSGNMTKCIIIKGYTMDELRNRKHVLLKFRQGYLGWVVLKDMQIEE